MVLVIQRAGTLPDRLGDSDLERFGAIERAQAVWQPRELGCRVLPQGG